MALNLYRADWDDTEIECWVQGERLSVPNFPDRYTIYESTPYVSLSDWYRWRPFVNDMELVLSENRFAPTETWWVPPASQGSEWFIRTTLAGMGFKPGPETFKKGFPLSGFSMSRVADLEDVGSTRGYDLSIPDSIVSHVVPYTLASFTAPSGPILPGTDATVLVDLEDVLSDLDWGYLLPYPWPRVLNHWRVWDVTNSQKWGPRGSYFAGLTGSGPDAISIPLDGTLRALAAYDSARFTDAGTFGSIRCIAGDQYEIQVGHRETGNSSQAGLVNIQRWYSDADGNLDWFPGDPIP